MPFADFLTRSAWRRGFAALVAGVLLLLPQALSAQETQTVEMSTIHGKMKYSVELFEVKPGAQVKIVFKNEDEMQHNLIILKPGSKATVVATKAWMLGAEAVKKQYVPDMPEVLFHTKIVNPRDTDTLTFKAPETKGDYPYICTLPGHVYSMKGVMRVRSGKLGLHDVEYKYYEGSWTTLPDFSKLTPVAKGTIAVNLTDLAAAKRPNHYGLVFTGKLSLTQDGDYTFSLASDDGSSLSVDGKQVVIHDGIHPVNAPKSGKINLTKGEHAFEVAYFQAGGGAELNVKWSGPGFAPADLSVAKSTAEADNAMKYHLHVHDQPMVIRSFLAGGSARSISVGLPGGFNYAFDAEKCAVEFAWRGMFLDVGPDRGRGVDRGGGSSVALGDRFEVGNVGCPIRIGDPAKEPSHQFGGYRRKGTPEFYYTVDKVKVSQTTEGAPDGLRYHFKLDGLGKEPVFFKVNPAGFKLASTAGQWDGGTLKLSSTEAREFTVTLTQAAK